MKSLEIGSRNINTNIQRYSNRSVRYNGSDWCGCGHWFGLLVIFGVACLLRFSMFVGSVVLGWLFVLRFLVGNHNDSVGGV